MNAPESNWGAWVRKAEHDLLNVRNNLAAPEVPWDTVCFHAQQAAEKMLKALLVFHGVQPWRTHDLVALAAECAERDPRAAELRAACLLLNPYSVETRYPDFLSEPDESEGRAAVEAAEHVRAMVLAMLRPPPLQEGGREP